MPSAAGSLMYAGKYRHVCVSHSAEPMRAATFYVPWLRRLTPRVLVTVERRRALPGMDDSKQNLYASTTSETPTPLKGRPAGTGHRTTSKAELPTSTVTAHGGALLIRDASGANGHGGPTEPAASEPGPVEQPDTRPAWRKAL